ncbi:MAG: hypothetical protein GWN00_34130, partial [Aliifodinibius sp.]|nr:hypothetical protein [Fodinibius sp.]NIV15769.1 hypothetical protein [Fodinibius sp.]NIY29643.1 hypothetical protein [Fodinibius sp.]
METGIDAENSENPNLNQNGIFLHWHPVNDDDLEAYDIYRKALDSTGTFNPIGVIRDDTTFLDMQVSTDTIYYYYVIARDEEN